MLPGQQSRTGAPVKETQEVQKQLGDADAPSSSIDVESAIDNSISKPSAKSKVKTKLVVGSSSRTKTRSKNASNDSPTSKVVPVLSKSDLKSMAANFDKAAEKRHHPGKLDIEAAKDASKKDMESVAASSAQSKSVDTGLISSTVSGTATPATAISQASASSAARQTQHRTFRVLPTPKVETPTRLIPASPSVMNAASSAATSKQHSRRPSLTSMQLPGTPVSEKISDNASFTSTSMSRANSPPPGKVGSAPVRQVTKSQQKKERQVRAKIAEENVKGEGSSAKPIAEEPEQAPIVGRKKKTKKANRGTADSTPVATRPTSPALKEEFAQDKALSRPVTPVKDNKNDTQEPETPASPVASTSGDQNQKNPLTAASILYSLQKSGEVPLAALDMFKSVPGLNYRFDLTHSDLKELIIPRLSAEDRCQSENGEAISVELGNNRYIILLPDGRTLRGFNKEQAQRYLELRKKSLSATEPTMFSSRHDLDRYLHAARHPGTAAQTNPIRTSFSSIDGSTSLINRFVTPASIPASSTTTMPSYWSPTPLTEEAMSQRRPIMGVEDAEQALLASRKETEGLEKKLNGLLKKNRRLLFGNSHW